MVLTERTTGLGEDEADDNNHVANRGNGSMLLATVIYLT
jgi:hypothetical protein